MVIRSAHTRDVNSIWRILEPVLREGETFAQPRDLGRDAARLSLDDLERLPS